MELNQVRGHFAYLVKKNLQDINDKKLIEHLKEAIKRIKDHSISIKMKKEIEDFKKQYTDRLEFLLEPIISSVNNLIFDTQYEIEQGEMWTEIEAAKKEFDEDTSEKIAYKELAEIIHYIKAKRQNITWAYMLNHPDSELWPLVGELGAKGFERLFMAKLREDGKMIKFPNQKNIIDDSRRFIAAWLKKKYPELSLKMIIDVINSQYTVNKKDFINERKVKHWLYERESNIVSSLEEYDPIVAVVYNAIKRKVFDQLFQEFLEKKLKEKKKYPPKKKTGRRIIGKG